MNTKLAPPAGVYPLSPALTLREACERTGSDDAGERCPSCPIRALCESENRWLIELVPRSRLH
jgi:hypothetical protein